MNAIDTPIAIDDDAIMAAVHGTANAAYKLGYAHALKAFAWEGIDGKQYVGNDDAARMILSEAQRRITELWNYRPPFPERKA